MTEEKEAKTQPESETKSKKAKKSDEVCNWQFKNYDDHYQSSCGMSLRNHTHNDIEEHFDTCPGCGKKIKLV